MASEPRAITSTPADPGWRQGDPQIGLSPHAPPVVNRKSVSTRSFSPSTGQSSSIANWPGVACPEAMLCSAAADGGQPLADLRRGSVSAGARLGAPNTGDPVVRRPWEMEEWLPHLHSDFTLQVPAATPWIPTPVTARHPRAQPRTQWALRGNTSPLPSHRGPNGRSTTALTF